MLCIVGFGDIVFIGKVGFMCGKCVDGGNLYYMMFFNVLVVLE